ncbi:hypothetical protein BKA93DRAFT_613291 [Sparassis latifolia]
MPPSYSPCPRPCLKRPSQDRCASPLSPRDESTQLLAIDPGILHPLVHFAPSTELASTHSAYSAAVYDRSPIVVLPNRCALPERGCPGRTYNVGDGTAPSTSRQRQRSPAARHRHPRAKDLDLPEDEDDDDLTPRTSPLAHAYALPPLVPDLSSESDESDAAPGEHDRALMFAQYAMTQRSFAGAGELAQGMSAMYINTAKPSALSFLPHPPSPRRAHSPTPPSREDEHDRRRHPPSASSMSRRKSKSGENRSPESPARARYKAFSEKSALGGGFGVGDLGCLGGF